MAAETELQAECRWCRRTLRGKPYYMGGRAYLLEGGEAKINWYGGYVCSRTCDVQAALELEQSMPWHGITQKRIGQEAQRRVDSNWPEGR